jgi:hypothetical protein
MRDLNIKPDLDQIGSIRKQYEKLSGQGKKLLYSLFEYLKSDDIKLNPEYEGEMIKFNLWGLSFIIKSESSWTKESPGFRTGEINLYMIKKKSIEEESNLLILTYSFDHIGNINSQYVVEEFSKFYYRDFIKKLIESCSTNFIKFGLTT